MSQDTRFRAGDLLEGRMRVVRAIRGGVGEVYLSVDENSGRPFALKRLQDRYVGVEKLRRAFQEEAKTWIALGRHPNIVQCVVLQNFYDEPYLVLEWVFGPNGTEPDLSKRMRSRRLDTRSVLEVGIDVCRGLQHAQDRIAAIVHRDLKPSNLLIGLDGAARITDFGMASTGIEPETDGGNLTTGGTPRYMAPEQWTGGPMDARTDIYALGCILFEALHGESPYSAARTEDFRRQHLYAPIPRMDEHATPEGLGELLQRCLAKGLGERPMPAELLHELADVYGRCFSTLPPERKLAATHEAVELQNRGATFFSLGQPEEAIRLFREALAMQPDYALCRANLAAALASLGRVEEAMGEAGRAIQDYPEEATAYVVRAQILLEREEFEPAILEFGRALEIDPRSLRAHLGRGEAYERREEWDNALADYTRASEIDPLHAGAWLRLGSLLDDMDSIPEAVTCYTNAIAAGGTGAEPFLRRGRLHYAQSAHRLAEADASAALESDPKSMAAYLLRGHARRNLGRAAGGDVRIRTKALEDYSHAIQLSRDEAYDAYVARGRMYSEDFQEKVAIADFSRAIEISPDRPEAWFERAQASVDIDRSGDAEADFVRCLQLRPKDYDTLEGLGRTYQKLQRWQDSLHTFSQAIKQDDGRAEAYVGRARSRLQLGSLKKALQDADRAIELAPNWRDALNIRSEIRRELGDERGAAEDYAQALVSGMKVRTIELPNQQEQEPAPSEAEDGDDTDPELTTTEESTHLRQLRMQADVLFDDGKYAESDAAYTALIEAGEASAEVLTRRGLCRVRCGALEAGIADYNRAIEVDGEYAIAYNNRGVALRSAKRAQDALADFDRSIKLDPHYSMAYINRAGAYQDAGDAMRALADFTRGIELDPDRAEGYADRAALYAGQGRGDEALSDLRRAIALNPDYAPAYCNLGIILANRGQKAEALPLLDRAAALGLQIASQLADRVRASLK